MRTDVYEKRLVSMGLAPIITPIRSAIQIHEWYCGVGNAGNSFQRIEPGTQKKEENSCIHDSAVLRL